jgi:hypothetical protein
MSEQGIGGAPGGGSGFSQSGASHPAQSGQIVRPASPPPEHSQPAARNQGYQPPGAGWQGRAGQQTSQPPQNDGQQPGGQQPPGDQQRPGEQQAQTVKIGDSEYSHDQVRAALKFKAEQDIRKSGLPASPDQYDLTLPADFRPPIDGVSFEFDKNSAELQNFRRLAHARGLDQQTFSEALGIYAANRIGEHQQLATARTAELTKLGSAAGQRLDAIDLWLRSQVGSKADLIVNQLKRFPVASMVEAFEQLARNASNQGSAAYRQDGRVPEEPKPNIPSPQSGASYAARRAAQDAFNAQLQRRR